MWNILGWVGRCMKKIFLNIILIMTVLSALSTNVAVGERVETPVPESIDSLKIDTPLIKNGSFGKIESSLIGDVGSVKVFVQMATDSVADIYAVQLDRSGGRISPEDLRQQVDQLRSLKKSQDKVVGAARELDPGVKFLGATQRLLNLVILEIDAGVLDDLAALQEVISITSILDYELALYETVPYIGAQKVQDSGYTGEGVMVAVLDSGIDYTHAALGGSGDPDDFTNNDPTIVERGTFPTNKVIGGYDFVGDAWPDGDLMPDADPLDKGFVQGHGTHVAHILGGEPISGSDLPSGVAPGVKFYALKVCSSISSACSGEALIRALDYAVDPNGDGRLTDAVDIVNLSLELNYGNPGYDFLSMAVDRASAIGILTVAAAGNDGDKPYTSGTPGGAMTALSVGATRVPSAELTIMEVTAPDDLTGQYAAEWQDWSEPLVDIYPDGLLVKVVYGNGAGGNLDGCQSFQPGTMEDAIVLVDRGRCTFTQKVLNIEAGGGLVGIIGLVAPGDPFNSAWDGSDYPNIPAYMVSQFDAARLKSGLPGTTINLDPSGGLPLVGHMAGYSSRGPSIWNNTIKPEIVAPDASVSAVAGTGVDISAFGGTSGAAPMVAGSAALLKEVLLASGDIHPKNPSIPFLLKSLLVTNAETGIVNRSEFPKGGLAPITRAGGGEVRIDRAVEAPIVLWEHDSSGMRFPHLSFGLVDIDEAELTIDKIVDVYNLTDQTLTYEISTGFRFEDDMLSEAVELFVIPSALTVPNSNGGKTPDAKFIVRMKIDGSKLNSWMLNSGVRGANGDILTGEEFDGYIWLDDTTTSADDDKMIHMPWHVLPRLSAEISSDKDMVQLDDEYIGYPAGTFELANNGIGTGYVNAYSWIVHSPKQASPSVLGDQQLIVDLKDVGVITHPVPAGYCSPDESFVMAFAITTYDRSTHAVANPVFNVLMDVDQDGTYDFDIFNFDASLDEELSDGRSVTWVADLKTGDAVGYFFLEHGTNSTNYVLTFCGEQIGLTKADYQDPIDIMITARDWFYSGLITDKTGVITIAPGGERYKAMGSDLDPFSEEVWQILDINGGNQSDMGILLLLDASRKTGIRSGALPGSESKTLMVSYP